MLQLPQLKNIFSASPEDEQVLQFQGGKQIPVTLTGANEFNVAADGSGDFLTIQEGVNALGGNAGTVRIKAGTYPITESIVLGGNSQTIIGSGWGTIIDASGTNYSIFDCDTNNASKTNIRDLQIDGNTNVGLIGIDIDNRSWCKIENVYFESVRSTVIVMEDHSGVTPQGNVVTNCLISNAGAVGIITDGNDHLILGNQITNSTGADIQLSGTNVICTNNHAPTITDTGTGTILANNI